MTNPSVRSIVQVSTPTLIAQQLRRLIGEGVLAPGDRINEAQLSRDFGVSRGPLREAMQRLSQEGLLITVRNKGVSVVELTEGDIRDVYTARSAIERAASEIVIEKSAVASGLVLLEAADAIETASEREDIESLIESDINFHSTLVAMSESTRLRQIHETLMIETRMCMLLESKYNPVLFRPDQHRAIAQAVHDADRELANGLIIEHLSLSGVVF